MLIANVAPRSMGKTTDTGWMLHALDEARASDGSRAYRPRGYDADHSRHLYSWAQSAGFPMPVIPLASARFHREAEIPPDMVTVVDCGHTENHPDITDSVLRVADLVVLHLTPSTSDVQRVIDPPVGVPIADMITRSAALRPSGAPPPAWALMNRVVANASSTAECREWLIDEGWKVLTTTIPNREAIKQSVGLPVTNAARGPFGELVTELQERGLISG